MASTQAETEAVPSKNGPEIKDQTDGQPSPITTNGVDSQVEEGATTNGPGHLNTPNNGAHEVNDVKLQGNYYKPLPPSTYPPSDGVAPGYENNQSAYGYLPHSYDGQHNSYPYQQQQFTGSNNSIRNTGPYMNSMPRAGAPPPQSPQSYPSHQGYMPPSRYPTPTLNQLLQPGSGAPVQRYPYGDYPPPPNSQQAAGWPMQQPQQPRSYAPSPGFKSPPNSLQPQGGPGGYPGYGASPAVPPGNNVQQPQQRYAVSPSGVPPMHQQHPEAVKNSGNGGVEPSAEVNSTAAANNAAVQQNSNSPSPSSSAPTSAAATTTPVTVTATVAAAVTTTSSLPPTSSVAATPQTSSSVAAAPLGSPAVIPPAPSPASRSMSPALGPPSNISPSPVVGPSENNSTGPARISHSPMAAQGAYQQPMPPPPHVGMSSFKMVGPPYPQQQQSMSGQPQQPQYLPNPMYIQQQQHARPPVMGPGGPNPYGTGPYGPPQQQPPQQHHPPQQPTPPHHHHQQPHQQGGIPPSSANNPMPPASPGPNRSLPPHMGPPTPYPGYPSGAPNMNQYVHQQPPQQPQQQQSSWGPNNPPGSPMQSMHGAGKGAPGPTAQAPGGNGPRTPAPPQNAPHYTKQHLQHHLQQQQQQKMYGMAPSPGPALPSAQGQQQQPPPGPQQQLLGPYTPTGNNMTSHPPSAASPVTSVVTTGPDGAALDEASQQSTLSNTSAASGDDASSAPSTPRSRKENSGPMSMTPTAQHHMPFPQHQQQHPMMSHPPTPQSTVPSPGAASLSSQHDDYNDGHSPGPVGNWAGISTRPTPSSPKTSHMSDSLARMYDFDDHPDRRKFLDQLLRFMEEKGSPITACPTISKNPLDLFRLYLLVRDRGGFLEVTKAKSWKDIAQTLGIGASSSAAYTLRKHYTKSLFLWECKFDRGGVDPQPILNQVEASTKKKPPKALSVPSPAGSSNSQDSFQSTGVPPAHPPMDGYPNYPGYPPPHAGENIAASNPFDDQQHYGARGGHPYPAPSASQQQQQPPPPPPSQQQQQPQQQQPQPQQPQQPPSMYNTMPGRPGYPNQGYHHPYQNDYSNPNNQQYPPYPNAPNRTMYPTPYPEPYNPQAPPTGPHQQGPPPPGPPGPAPTDPYGRYMPPNHGGGSNAAPGSYPPRPTAPSSTATVHPPSVSTTPAPAPSPSPASVASSAPATLPVAPSPLSQSMQQPQQPQGNSSAGPSPAPSPAPNAGGPVYPEQNDQFQRSGLRQLLATSTLAQQLATPSPDSRQPGYPGGNVPGSLASSTGQPYPNMVRPGTPVPAPPGMPSRQSTPTPLVPTPSSGIGASNSGVSAPPPVPAGQQQQQLAPYPNYGPPGQAPNQQPRPSYDPYSGYRSPYGPPGPLGDPSGSANPSLNNNMAAGWRGSAPYGNQYPPQGGSPGPVQTAGAPWVPPTGTPQPRNPAWDQNQRYPGPIPAAPATTYNGTSHQGPTPTMPPQHQQQPQWAGPPSMSNSRPPYPMGPRPPYRPSDGKPHSMPPMPSKGPMNINSGLPGSASYPPSGMQGGPIGMPVYAAKREASYFPPDCVEGVVPVMNKRRRVGRADVSPVDPWRLYLALKSGLLGESTWAIDILNILLYDDVGVQYFSLAYMPGLVEVLLEHFRRCLSQIFTILDDMEMGFSHVEDFKSKLKQRVIKDSSLEAHHGNSSQMNKETKTAEDDEDEEEAWWNWPKRKTEPDRFEAADLGSVKESDLIGERVRFLEGPDWSMSSRRSEKIGTVSREKELFILDNKKDWDVHDGTGSSTEQTCGSDTSQHIVTHFTAELSIVPFVRILKQKKKNFEQVVDGTNASEETESEPVEQSSVVFQIERQPIEPSVKTKNCKAKLGRSLADVLQRIKREDPPSSPSVNHENSNDKNSAAVQVTEEKAVEVQPTDANSWEIKKEHCNVPVKREVALSPAPTSRECDPSSAESRAGTLIIRDPHGTLKRKKMDDYEDECFTRDESSLYLVDDSQDALSRRALALSNIFRSLSFVPSNEGELAKNSTLLVIVGKLLLLHHDHPVRSAHQKNYDREEDIDFTLVDTLTSSNTSAGSVRLNETDWWWDTLLALRENVLVLMANIAGQLDLSMYSEEIVRPLIDGLLHWAVCPSAQSQDPFGSFGPCSTSLLSPQRLSLEALCKLLVMDANMDLILATPPFSRLEKLVHFLTRSLCRTEDQVLREFSINLLYYFSAADSGMARLIALHNNSLALLVSFVEQAEANALAVASQHGIQALRENPESMGTSLDMLRRAASTLFHIARHPDSRPLLAKLEQRLLALVMSQIMDQSVAALLSKSLYLCNSIDE